LIRNPSANGGHNTSEERETTRPCYGHFLSLNIGGGGSCGEGHKLSFVSDWSSNILTGAARWQTSVARHYGRKSGWIRHHAFLIMYLFGKYGQFARIQWGQVKRLVFVCKGNICRSPYGEARAREFGVPAISCGLQADKGSPADQVALVVSSQRALDLSLHRSRAVTDVPVLPGDLFVAMEPWQGKRLRRLRVSLDVQVTLLGLWHSRPRPHIEDPYGLDDQYFETCFTIMDDAIQHIVTHIKRSDAEQ
jgi:protein-tyrosine phosphatase